MVAIRTGAREGGGLRAKLCPLWVDTVEKGFWGRSLSNIDSRSNATAQSRFKNPFVRIRLFQILIPQLHFGDFFNSIGHSRPKPSRPLALDVRFAPKADKRTLVLRSQSRRGCLGPFSGHKALFCDEHHSAGRNRGGTREIRMARLIRA